MLLDGKQSKNPSCTRQPDEFISSMTQSGGEHGLLTVKRYCPCAGFASSLRAKSWLLDDLVYVGGSYNFTMNAEKNNGEHLVVMKGEAVCQVYNDWFYSIWNNPRAEVVTCREILALKGQRASRSKSQSRPR